MIITLITPTNFRYKASCKACPTVFVCAWEDFQNKYADKKDITPCYIVECPTCGAQVGIKDCELFQKEKSKDEIESVDIVQSLQW